MHCGRIKNESKVGVVGVTIHPGELAFFLLRKGRAQNQWCGGLKRHSPHLSLSGSGKFIASSFA
jgi:hypothetical protein